MAFTVKEYKTSRSGTAGKLDEKVTLEAVGHGTTDNLVARLGFMAFFPLVYEGLTRGDINYRTLGGELWVAEVIYAPDDAPLYPPVGIIGPPQTPPVAPGLNTPLGPNYTFDINGVSEHILQSKETLNRTKRGGGAAPDNKGAIGITQDGEVKGVDRVTGFIEWRVAVTFGSISMAYVQEVGGMVGTTNNAQFFGYPAGSLLFMGGNLQTRDTVRAVGEFKFGYSKNLSAVTICEGLTVPARTGWTYLWVAYKELQDAGKLTQQPDAAYTERIYDPEDFSKLRIGA